MDFTLAFHIHNKAYWITSVLDSWLSGLSGHHSAEVICIFDDTTDHSPAVVAHTLAFYNLPYRFFHTLGAWEIGADNLALSQAEGEFIVFIQDDNWIHDNGWDRTLALWLKDADIGAVGLLAGVMLKPDMSYMRVECDRPHKREHFTRYKTQDYPLGVYEVDFVTRPLAVRTALAREVGGFDPAFYPMDWDESDFSFRLSRAGYASLVAPFDLVNPVGKQATLGSAKMTENFLRGREVFLRKHAVSLRQLTAGRAPKLAEAWESLGVSHA